MNGLMRPVPKEPERKATRPLRADELRAIWTGAEIHLTPKFARMIKLALLLGRRRAEIAKAEIAELNLQKNAPQWIIRPREGNKSSSESLVPLPRLAAELLRAAVADARSVGIPVPATQRQDQVDDA